MLECYWLYIYIGVVSYIILLIKGTYAINNTNNQRKGVLPHFTRGCAPL